MSVQSLPQPTPLPPGSPGPQIAINSQITAPEQIGGLAYIANFQGVAGVQTPSGAASFTVDPTKGAILVVNPVTAAITITAPPASNSTNGQLITISLLQDGTGHAVTMTNFKMGANSVSSTASKCTTMQFIYDTTSWNLIGFQGGI